MSITVEDQMAAMLAGTQSAPGAVMPNMPIMPNMAPVANPAVVAPVVAPAIQAEPTIHNLVGAQPTAEQLAQHQAQLNPTYAPNIVDETPIVYDYHVDITTREDF